VLYKCIKGANIAIALVLLARQGIVEEKKLYLVFYLSISTGNNTGLI
jgi:hypothetical protein